MTPEDFQKKKTYYKKRTAEYRNTGRISECFYHDKTKCAGPIKQSHSIQRNGRLSIIEGDVKGNKMIYTFTESELDEHTYYKTLKPIGKAAASTFFGFCDHHDTHLFSPIETKPFDGSDFQCFLHSYRAFAHSYHRKKEELRAYLAESDFTKQIPMYLRRDLIKANEIGVAEGEIAKKMIDSMMEKSDYEGLEYFIHTIPDCFPIACSSQIMPPYSINGVPLNNHDDPNIPFSGIMLTVLPDNNQTIIILACFPDDEKAIILFDELEQLPILKLHKAISTLLITCAENTFFSPALWNALGHLQQRQLCSELRQAADLFYQEETFQYSKINFFDNKFGRKRLKF